MLKTKKDYFRAKASFKKGIRRKIPTQPEDFREGFAHFWLGNIILNFCQGLSDSDLQ